MEYSRNGLSHLGTEVLENLREMISRILNELNGGFTTLFQSVLSELTALNDTLEMEISKLVKLFDDTIKNEDADVKQEDIESQILFDEENFVRNAKRRCEERYNLRKRNRSGLNKKMKIKKEMILTDIKTAIKPRQPETLTIKTTLLEHETTVDNKDYEIASTSDNMEFEVKHDSLISGCTFCPYKISNCTPLSDHVKRNHGVPSLISKVDDVQIKSEFLGNRTHSYFKSEVEPIISNSLNESITCPLCIFTTRWAYSLTQHLLRSHIDQIY